MNSTTNQTISEKTEVELAKILGMLRAHEERLPQGAMHRIFEQVKTSLNDIAAQAYDEGYIAHHEEIAGGLDRLEAAAERLDKTITRTTT